MARMHVPPSRTRYEARNPVVSARVPAALKERLDALRRADGTTVSVLLAEALARRGPDLARATEDAYARGFEAARRVYATRYRCARCDRPMEAVGDAIHASLAKHAEAEGWYHGSGCGGADAG
jgi:predicted transcriptional regulator